MTHETYLSHELSSAELIAQYDEHAKRIVADKGVLAYILLYTVDEFKDYSLEEISAAIQGEPEISSREVRPTSTKQAIISEIGESNLPGEGKIFFDIVFHIITKDSERKKIYINLEVQKDFHPGYDLVTRGIVYAARLLSQQLDTEYTPDNYDGAKKVYSIWVCMDTPISNKSHYNVANTITKYSIAPQVIYPSQTNVFLGRYDLLSVIFICLKNNSIESDNRLVKMLSTLFSDNLNVSIKKKILEEDYNLPMTQEMEKEVSIMCNLGEGIYEAAYKTACETIYETAYETAYEAAYKEIQNNLQLIIDNQANELVEKDSILEAQAAKIKELEALLANAN